MGGIGGFDDAPSTGFSGEDDPDTNEGDGKELAELGRTDLAPDPCPALTTTEDGSLSERNEGPPSELLRAAIFTGAAAGGSSRPPREAEGGLVMEAVGSDVDTAGTEQGCGISDTWLGRGAVETEVESAC